MALVAKKLEGETWRQAALRYAAKHGLEDEVEAAFNELARRRRGGGAGRLECVRGVGRRRLRGSPVKTFAVYMPGRRMPPGAGWGWGVGGALVNAWTAKGARRKWRRRMREVAPPDELTKLAVYEVTSALAPNGNHIIQETRVA